MYAVVPADKTVHHKPVYYASSVPQRKSTFLEGHLNTFYFYFYFFLVRIVHVLGVDSQDFMEISKAHRVYARRKTKKSVEKLPCLAPYCIFPMAKQEKSKKTHAKIAKLGQPRVAINPDEQIAKYFGITNLTIIF